MDLLLVSDCHSYQQDKGTCLHCLTDSSILWGMGFGKVLWCRPDSSNPRGIQYNSVVFPHFHMFQRGRSDTTGCGSHVVCSWSKQNTLACIITRKTILWDSSTGIRKGLERTILFCSNTHLKTTKYHIKINIDK